MTLRAAVSLIAATALAGCGSKAGGTGPSPAGPVRRVDFVTRGSNVAYSAALSKIAFSRFDPAVVGAPDLAGQSDGTGTFQLFVAEPDGRGERCLTCTDVAGGPRRNRHVGAATWHASGGWLVVAVEMPAHLAPHAKCHAGLGS
jgi:hypothetical protein